MVLKPATFFGEAPQSEIDDKNHSTLEVKVADALASSGGIDASDVLVTTQGSTIVLSGMVAMAEEVDRAAEVAKAVPGVASVTNQIRVG
jgi:osmotically-inducible protein OsmY